MATQKAGRPAKPDQNKRQQLHISLYADDLERLDRLTDNRSEFIRQCIAKAWAEQQQSATTHSVAVPKSLARELRRIADQLEPHKHSGAYPITFARLSED
jgi:hypothetical protein